MTLGFININCLDCIKKNYKIKSTRVTTPRRTLVMTQPLLRYQGFEARVALDGFLAFSYNLKVMECPCPTSACDVTSPSCAFSLSASFKAKSNRINQNDTLKGSSELFCLYSLACATVHAWLDTY